MKIVLIIIHLFVGLTALWGGVSLVLTNGSGIPLGFLENSPFDSFIIPGLILVIVVGGTQLAAAFFQYRKNTIAPELSAVAGFGILIWIYTELTMILESSWLQNLYFTLGILTLTLAILQLRLQKSIKFD